MIKELAEKEDISYLKASEILAPEYAKTIRIRDEAFEDEIINTRKAYLDKLWE